MTDDEIIKALKDAVDFAECVCGYPYYDIEVDLIKNTIDLIKKQKAEIDRIEASKLYEDSKEIMSDDLKFMLRIISEICEYAKRNNMKPDETLVTVADNIKAICEIATFDNWKKAYDQPPKGAAQ